MLIFWHNLLIDLVLSFKGAIYVPVLFYYEAIKGHYKLMTQITGYYVIKMATNIMHSACEPEHEYLHLECVF